MSTKYKFREPDRLYFITFAVVYWIDLFIRNEYKDIMLDSWRYCQANKGLEIYSWCIMSSHVHMIVATHGDPLEDIMRDMKKHTSVAFKNAIKNHPAESRREWMLALMEKAGTANSQNVNFQLWQQDNHPIMLFDQKILHQKLNYIHDNPVVAGIVDRPEDYSYSSARDYYGIKGLLEIELADVMVQ